MSSFASNKKSPASKAKRRPLQSTEMETTDSSGNKVIVTETFYDDGSSVKEKKVFENNKVISKKITETPPRVSRQKVAPATKTLPVDELLTSNSEVRRITENDQFLNTVDEEHTKSDQQDEKMPSMDTPNSNFARNTDLEDGLVARSDQWNDSSSQTSADSAGNQVDPPNELEIVEAYIVPSENQHDPAQTSADSVGNQVEPPFEHEIVEARVLQIANQEDPGSHQPKERNSMTPKFRTEDGKLNKKFWLLLFIILLLIAVIGISVNVTRPKSSAQSSERITVGPTPIPTFAPTSIPSLSPTQIPTFAPTVTTECSNLCVEEISDKSECPSAPERRALSPCNKIHAGELCVADGGCGIPTNLNNCENDDVYRRVTCKIDEPWAVELSENGYEYYVELEEMDWFSHNRKSARNDAFLVSLHSHEERTFVVNQLRRNNITKAFIGGIRKGLDDEPLNKTGQDERYWRWLDGTPWDYFSWNIGEPNYNGINSLVESVVELDHGMNDVPPGSNKAGVYRRRTSRKPYTYTYNLPQSFGGTYSCVTNNQMELFCMGYNNDGHLGGSIKSSSTNVPTLVTDLSANKKVKSFGIGFDHLCAILDDNSLDCWGSNYFGQLGLGNKNTQTTPTSVNRIGRTATQISLGRYHTCAIINNTSTKCWGDNYYGQLGLGSNQDTVTTPQSVNISPERTIKQISCGGFHTCAVLDNGSVTCWGRNNYGQLGGGTNETKSTTPVDVVLDKKVKMVSSGRDSTCVILEDNSLKCWGRNDIGQLGINTLEDQSLPTDVDIGSNNTIKHISSSSCGYHRCAIRNDNRLLCWGLDEYGQLGTGSYNDDTGPFEIYLNEKLVKQVSVGYSHTCAILFDETLKCWGSNYYGTLGYENYTSFNDASKVISLKF